MPNFCAVINCGSTSARNKISFFRFPSIFDNNKRVDIRKQKRREAWISALKRANMTELKLKYQMICAKHFLKGKPAKLEDEDDPDWIPSQDMGYKRPTVNLQRYDRRKRRKLEANLAQVVSHQPAKETMQDHNLDWDERYPER